MISVCVAYSGRADANPLKPVIAALRAAGAEGFKVNLEGHDTPKERIRSAWNAADWLSAKPDGWLLVLGDRFEILEACLTAVICKIRIAHIHGGETSEGSFDDSIRNAISMLADLHFVSAEPHRRKLIGMGINPDAIHVVGAPGLDNIADLPPRKPERLFVVTYHPATRAQEDVRELLAALNAFQKHRVVFTGVNADPGAYEIRKWIADWGGGEVVADMGASDYFALLRRSACMIGNSSSGLIEAPSLQVAAVNIGDRQKGRLRGAGVIDCPCEHKAIIAAIEQAIAYQGPWDTPYRRGASKRIAEILCGQESVAALC